ncbi:LysR family transcriptional regulator [Veronia nyctiphanis]|uniref:LysR family transcriptional regulator n=1 Tax=Veronia nyctiphanis TaxID=1278244 RepID=A0A4Q0YR25_9GAMM|nr:LysR substrate-binding domain-containing protein [Veronia nyctiphanis]RXJ73620.1 LysR family transcriptional regulator [Veronia nyctiphanis]
MEQHLRHLHALRYFEAAARRKSYSAAAIELSVTQAAVSQQIRGLEDNLDIKLFFRQGREMLLTSSGQKLYDSVNKGFREISAGLDMLKCEPMEGVLTVNTPPSFASLWLMPRLWQFTHTYPSTTLRVHADRERVDIRYTDTDIAIRQGIITNDELLNDVVCEPLYSEPVFPLCSATLAENLQFTHPDQVLNCMLIHGVNSRAFNWKKWFEVANVDWQQKDIQWMEVPTFDMALNAVMAGHGMCLATESLSRDLIDNGLLVKPFDIPLSPGVKYSLVYQKNSPRRKRVQAFIDWIKLQVDEQEQQSTKCCIKGSTIPQRI